MAAILVVFVLIRLPLLTNEAAVRGWNGDSAIFGLMAKKIHDGKGFDVFFWGQNYMGPLTPALAALIRKTVLDPAGLGAEGGPISLRLASMSEIAFGICFYFLGLVRLFGRPIATAAGLWMAIGPPFFIRLSAVHRGGLGPEMSFALGSVLFFLAAGALTRPRPILGRPVGLFVLGLIGGFGWWMNQTIVFVLLPVAALVFFRSATLRGFPWKTWARLTVPCLCGAVLGYSPVWLGRLLGWYEPYAGPVTPPGVRSGLLIRFSRFVGTDSWRLVGLDALAPPALLAVAGLSLLTLLLLVHGRRFRRALQTEPPGIEGLDLVGAIAGLGAAFFIFRDVPPSQIRYLTPVLPAALALLLASLAEAARFLRRRIPSALVALLLGGLALATTLFLSRQARRAVDDILLEPDPRAPLTAIYGGGYTVCHAGYDTAYTLQFLSDERVRFIPYHSPDRNRTMSASLRSMPGPQCLVAEDGAVRPWEPSDAAQEGGPARRRAERR